MQGSHCKFALIAISSVIFFSKSLCSFSIIIFTIMYVNLWNELSISPPIKVHRIHPIGFLSLLNGQQITCGLFVIYRYVSSYCRQLHGTNRFQQCFVRTASSAPKEYTAVSKHMHFPNCYNFQNVRTFFWK